MLSDKTIDDKLMHILNNDKQNYPICKFKVLVKSLDTANLN